MSRAVGGLCRSVRPARAAAVLQRGGCQQWRGTQTSQGRYLGRGSVRGAGGAYTQRRLALVQHVGRSRGIAASLSAESAPRPPLPRTSHRQQEGSSELHKASPADHLPRP